MPNIWFNRIYENTFTSLLQEGKVLVLYGPRYVGKTALITKILGNYKNKIYKGTGDDLELRELPSSQKLIFVTIKLKTLLFSFTTNEKPLLLASDFKKTSSYGRKESIPVW